METSVATRDQNMDKEPVFINTQEGMSDLVDWIAGQETWLGNLQPPLYIDIEGERLSRHGKVSLLTVLVHLGKHHEHAHVIDIHTLGTVAFSTVGSRGKSFKDILESTQILKVFFDVRNDSDALYAHYGIKLQGIYDVQLMESARRPDTGRRKFKESSGGSVREKGETLWNPAKGGSYSVFNIRPVSDEIISYCVGDVQYLPALYHIYRCDTDRWNRLVAGESQKRASASQMAEYQPEGPGRALSPWSPEQNKMLDSWYTRTTLYDYFAHVSTDKLADLDRLRRDDAPEDTWDGNYYDDYDDLADDNDFEDWTRMPWQGPPS